MYYMTGGDIHSMGRKLNAIKQYYTFCVLYVLNDNKETKQK